VYVLLLLLVVALRQTDVCRSSDLLPSVVSCFRHVECCAGVLGSAPPLAGARLYVCTSVYTCVCKQLELQLCVCVYVCVFGALGVHGIPLCFGCQCDSQCSV
jgi:hypothetical protein